MFRFVIGLFASIQGTLKTILNTIANIQQDVNSILPGYKYRGSVAQMTDLPQNPETGDLYTVEGENYVQYAWDGQRWITPNYPSLTEEQIDSLFLQEE